MGEIFTSLKTSSTIFEGFEKGQVAQLGEVRTWSDGKKYRKTAIGWVPVAESSKPLAKENEASGKGGSKKVTLKELPALARKYGLTLDRVKVRGFVDGFFLRKGPKCINVFAKDYRELKYKDENGNVISGGPEIIADYIEKYGKEHS